MKPCVTITGKKFLLDRCTFVARFQELDYFTTAAGNIVRLNADGTWSEITKAQAQANILLMPYNIAFELFPTDPVFNETI